MHVGFKLSQKDAVRAVSRPFLWGDMSLVVHEGIQNAHQGGALSGKVLDIQDLVSCNQFGAGGGFQFLLIAADGKLAGGVEEVLCLVKHSLLLQAFPEDFKVPSL